VLVAVDLSQGKQAATLRPYQEEAVHQVREQIRAANDR
jgi:hypothetical protein